MKKHAILALAASCAATLGLWAAAQSAPAPAPATATTVVWRNLEATAAPSQIGPNINSVPADFFEGALLPSGSWAGWLKVSNGSSQRMGGGLLGWKFAYPSMGQALTYWGLDFDCYMPATEISQLARREQDLKVVAAAAPSGATAANVLNGSTQRNFDEGGMYQIDKAGGGWADTGYNPPVVVGSTVHVALRYSVNWSAGTYSVTSILEGPGTPYTAIPPTLQNLPLETSNWGAVVAPQLQTESYGGGVSLLYQNVTVAASTQPIP